MGGIWGIEHTPYVYYAPYVYIYGSVRHAPTHCLKQPGCKQPQMKLALIRAALLAHVAARCLNGRRTQLVHTLSLTVNLLVGPIKLAL